jgi:hypothetical protein
VVAIGKDDACRGIALDHRSSRRSDADALKIPTGPLSLLYKQPAFSLVIATSFVRTQSLWHANFADFLFLRLRLMSPLATPKLLLAP